MPLVTGIEPQARRKDRFNLFLDGSFAMALHGDVARTAHLVAGMTLQPAELRDLAGREAFLTALDTAYRFLAHRPRSESEVRARLRRARVDETTASVVLSNLRELRLLDDTTFARLWTEDRQGHNPRSRRMVQWELRRKGIALEVAEQATGRIDDDDAALHAAMRRARRGRETDYETFRKRLGDFLLRRGFSYATARRTVERLWKEGKDSS